MARHLSTPALAAALLYLLPCASWAAAQAQHSSNSVERESLISGSTSSQSATQAARQWGLNAQEWQRYRSLMQGPRGMYSPGLDPLTALGVEAESDNERRRYAELQVRAEARRVEKELAYDQAYRDAWNRLYPNLQPIQLGDAAPLASPAVRGRGRLAVFVKEDCQACTAQVQQLQSSGQGFDLYMVGSQNEDARLRRWAVLAGLDPAQVRARKITLNHDAGHWLQLGLEGELPAVVREVDGQWRRQ